MITKFYLFESLGVMTSLETLANDIIEHLKKDSYYKLETNYRGKDVIINCYKLDKLSYAGDNIQACFSIEDVEKNEVNIKTTTLRKGDIIHELKHFDYAISHNWKVDTYYYLNHIGRYVLTNLNYLVKNNDILSDVLYLINPDEFSAYYQSHYYELLDLLNDQKIDKREIIDNYLNSQTDFILYKFFDKNGFDIKDYFKSTRDLIQYLNDLSTKIDQFYDKDDKFYYSFSDKIGKKAKYYLNKLKSDIDMNKDCEKIMKELNNYINDEVKRNYKKYYRLYTLLEE